MSGPPDQWPLSVEVGTRNGARLRLLEHGEHLWAIYRDLGAAIEGGARASEVDRITKLGSAYREGREGREAGTVRLLQRGQTDVDVRWSHRWILVVRVDFLVERLRASRLPDYEEIAVDIERILAERGVLPMSKPQAPDPTPTRTASPDAPAVGEVATLITGAEVLEIDGEYRVRVESMRTDLATREAIAAELGEPLVLYRPSGASARWYLVADVEAAVATPEWMARQCAYALNADVEADILGAWSYERPEVLLQAETPMQRARRVAAAVQATREAPLPPAEPEPEPEEIPAPADPFATIRAALDQLEQRPADPRVAEIEERVAQMTDVMQSQQLAIAVLERHVSLLTSLLQGQAAVALEQLQPHPTQLEEAH